MAYTETTLSAAITALSGRLADPGAVRWTRAELAIYIREAIRTWSALTQGFRDRGVFATRPGVAFYDLGAEIPALRAMTVTDWDLITEIQYHLLEPPGPTAWTGSAQFTLAMVTEALQGRRDRFLQETGAVLRHTQTTISPPPQGVVSLPETVLTLRRVAWRLTTGYVQRLLPSDEWSYDHFKPGWVQQPARPPRSYSLAVAAPTRMQVAPPPLDTGTLDLVAVHRGARLDPAVAATPIGVPDDWAWVVKFGALADLLSRDGLALDTDRAAYCEARWQHGVQLAAAASVILAARINNVPTTVGAVEDADSYSPGWQSVPGTPRRPLTLGQNLVGLWPVPGVAPLGGGWSVTLDVVRNAPVPANVGDYLQVGADQVDPILEYAQHLALFKEGPGQLAASQPLAASLIDYSGVALQLQQASQPARAPMLDQTAQGERSRPRVLPPVETGAGGGG